MKKRYFWYASMLLVALSLALTACNQGVTAGTGAVRIVIANGATRAVNAEGMPQFDGHNITITITDEDGTELKKATGVTPITLTHSIDKKITVKVVVKTDAGEWRGVAEHTVTEGTNTVAVKLSKAPLNVGNILSNVESGNPLDPTITLKLAGGKELVAHVQITGNHLDRPVIARDSSGRIYMFYDKDGRCLTRFDAEGNPHCEIDLHALLPSIFVSAMTVDAKTNTIFVFNVNATNVYALTESRSNTFTRSDPFDISTLPGGASTDRVSAAAAYNGVLFLVTLDEKSPVLPQGTNPGVGYRFYRFIAVKPKKLIIASNGACAIGGNASGSQTPPPDPRSDNKVVTYNLEGSLTPSEVDAGGKFYKKLPPGSGFAWE